MAKQCKTITISNCPPDDSCNGCVDIVKSQCIKYTGADLEFLGVVNGDTLDQILIKLNSVIGTLSGS
jgi:hypothetical protein